MESILNIVPLNEYDIEKFLNNNNLPDDEKQLNGLRYILNVLKGYDMVQVKNLSQFERLLLDMAIILVRRYKRTNALNIIIPHLSNHEYAIVLINDKFNELFPQPTNNEYKIWYNRLLDIDYDQELDKLNTFLAAIKFIFNSVARSDQKTIDMINLIINVIRIKSSIKFKLDANASRNYNLPKRHKPSNNQYISEVKNRLKSQVEETYKNKL